VSACANAENDKANAKMITDVSLKQSFTDASKMQIQLSGQPFGGQASVEMAQNTKFYALNRRSASNGKNELQRL
jgi:hypothetical protein